MNVVYYICYTLYIYIYKKKNIQMEKSFLLTKPNHRVSSYLSLSLFLSIPSLHTHAILQTYICICIWLRIKAMDPRVCEYIIYSSLVYSRIVAVVYASMCVERVTLKNNQTQRKTRVCVCVCVCIRDVRVRIIYIIMEYECFSYKRAHESHDSLSPLRLRLI